MSDVCVCSRLLAGAGAGVQAGTKKQTPKQSGTLLFVACAQLPCCTGSPHSARVFRCFPQGPVVPPMRSCCFERSALLVRFVTVCTWCESRSAVAVSRVTCVCLLACFVPTAASVQLWRPMLLSTARCASWSTTGLSPWVHPRPTMCVLRLMTAVASYQPALRLKLLA